MAGNTPNHGLDTLNSVSEEKNIQNTQSKLNNIRTITAAAALGLAISLGAPNTADAQNVVDPNATVLIGGEHYTYRTLAYMEQNDLRELLQKLPSRGERGVVMTNVSFLLRQDIRDGNERLAQATERNRQATERNRQATERNRQATERNRQATERNRQATERNRQATEMAGQAQAFEQAVHTALDPNTPINERRDAVKQVLELRDQLDFLPEETKRNATIAMNDIKQKYNIVP